LLLRAVGFEPAVGPEPLIAARLARIAAVAQNPSVEPELAALVESQRVRIETELRYDLRTPLELASYLASADERQGPAGGPRVRDEILGLPAGPEPTATDSAAVAGASEPAGPTPGPTPTPSVPAHNAAASLVTAIPALLDTRRAVLLLDDEQSVPPPVHTEAPPGTPATTTPATSTGETE
jgi:hypothetical protein